jgi:hypothetical protein
MTGTITSQKIGLSSRITLYKSQRITRFKKPITMKEPVILIWLVCHKVTEQWRYDQPSSNQQCECNFLCNWAQSCSEYSVRESHSSSQVVTVGHNDNISRPTSGVVLHFFGLDCMKNLNFGLQLGQMNKHSFLSFHRTVFTIPCTLTSHFINMDLVFLHTWRTKYAAQTAQPQGFK